MISLQQNKIVNFKSIPQGAQMINPGEKLDLPIQEQPMDDMFLMQTIAQQNADRREKSRDNWNKAGVIAQALIGLGFIGSVVVGLLSHNLQKQFLAKQFPKKKNNIKKLEETFIDMTKEKSIPDVDAKSLNPKVKKFIKEVVDAMGVSKEIVAYSGSAMPPRMVLFHGPTGTGKTFSAKIFAKAQGANYTEIQFSELSSKYIGETSVNITNKFNEFAKIAKKNPEKKYVVTFNEIDSLINNVEKLGENNKHLGQNRTSFLNGLDLIKDIPNLTIVGTTNINPKSAKLDAATLGRFGNIFEVPLPTKDELKSNLEWQLRNCEAIKKHDFFNKNSSAIDSFIREMVRKNCSHRDVEKVSESALAKFKIAIKDKSDPLNQAFEMKYLKEALKEKEVMASGIGKKSSSGEYKEPNFIQKILLLFTNWGKKE